MNVTDDLLLAARHSSGASSSLQPPVSATGVARSQPEDAAAIVAALGQRAKAAAVALRNAGTAAKNEALTEGARLIRAEKAAILAANARDIQAAKAAGMSTALQDRLLLDDARVEAMARGLDEIAALPDPVGAEIERWQRPNGLEISRVRVPIGIIGVIYEAPPKRDGGRRRALHQVGQRRGAARRLRQLPFLARHRRAAAPRARGRRPARGLRRARADDRPRRRRRTAEGDGLARPDRAARRPLADRSRDGREPRAGAAPLRRHLPRLCRPRRRRGDGARCRGQRKDAPGQRLRRRGDVADRPRRARHPLAARAREAARAGLRGAR